MAIYAGDGEHFSLTLGFCGLTPQAGEMDLNRLLRRLWRAYEAIPKIDFPCSVRTSRWSHQIERRSFCADCDRGRVWWKELTGADMPAEDSISNQSVPRTLGKVTAVLLTAAMIVGTGLFTSSARLPRTQEAAS
ncbi:hypothetical protein [Cupriavidus metallidurans]|jgi:hypothetical protein|uniref:hypothetical protein n=1 Tax=Cupriavidus metallidurans TaxID=119219 RepID=UPI001647A80D|nr:hypothetical protein [Cupriavidus metallidurans]